MAYHKRRALAQHIQKRRSVEDSERVFILASSAMGTADAT